MYTKLILSSFACLFSLMSFSQTALNFDGTNDYVNCGNDPILDLTGNQVTLEAWVYPTSFKPLVWQGNVINKGDDTQSGYMLRVGGTGQVNFNIGSGGFWNELNSGSGVLTLNNWQHIAGVYDGVTMQIYVNGVSIASTPLSVNIASSFQPLFLGDDPQYVGRYFPGSIDEARVWNVARTATEIQNGMNSEICNTTPSLLAYYRFNNGVAGGNNAGQITLSDDSGNGLDGTLINFANMGASSNWVTGTVLGPGMISSIAEVDACQSYTWASNGQTYTTSGIYSDMFTASTGCDSLAILDLSIFNPNNLTTNNVVCDSFVWGVNGTTYYATQSVVETLTTSQGCQYNHTLNITVNESFDTTVLVYDECSPYVWPVNGQTYATSGNYTANLTTAQGCDSTINLNLVIYQDAVADLTENTDGSLSTTWTSEIQWVDCLTNQPISGATGQSFIPTANGSYQVIAFGPNFCPDTSDCYNVAYIGVDEISTFDFTIQPNPTSGELTVTLPEAWNSGSIEVLSLEGKILSVMEFNQLESIDLEVEGTSGVYFIRVKNNLGEVATKPVMLR